MDPQRYDLVASIFAEVRPLPPEPRAAALDRLCAGDPELRGEVEMYLRHDAGDGPSLLSTPVVADPALIHRLLGADEEEFPPGSRISAFTVVRRLGEGGFGAVYLAEQSSPRRQVAVKVIKPGHASPQAMRRLERESDILARLHHPSIAQVFEAGTLPGPVAVPYFVMEYVEGVPISRYSIDQGLSVTGRVNLFLEVCDAVRHANANGVIHRDLKPANILVTRDGRPKILDFGIARELDSELKARSLTTSTGQLVGTLAYMSPEQAAGEPADSASDAYSLGVLLYELLTRRLPIEVDNRSLADALRGVMDRTPPKLSSFDRSLHGDLEVIVAKALEKHRERRYHSASELADDVRRFLINEPILARAPSMTYKLVKFASRNTALVVSAAVFVAFMFGAIVVLSITLKEKNLSEAKARQSATDALASEANSLRSAGRWDELLKSADAALASGLIRDDVPLRLLKVEARLATGEPALARRELFELEKRGPRADVLLALGDLALGAPEPTAKSEAMIRSALQLGLTDADRLYAEALLTERPSEFVRGMERALVADPFSVRVNRMLAVGYFLVGRVDDMDRPLDFLTVVTPRDWQVPAMRAVRSYLQGDHQGGDRFLQRVEELAGSDRSKVIRNVLQLFEEVSQPGVIAGLEKKDPFALLMNSFATIMSAYTLVGNDQGGSSIIFPPFLMRTVELGGSSSPMAVALQLRSLVWPNTVKGLPPLVKAADRSELGIARFMLAKNQDRFKLYSEALDNYERAAKMDSFLRIRAAACYGAARAAFSAREQVVNADPQAAAAFAHRMSSAALETYQAGGIPTNAMADLAEKLALVGERNTAKILAYQLLAKAPKDPHLIYTCMFVEFTDGNYATVIRLADEGIVVAPQDKRVLEWRAKAVNVLSSAAGDPSK